MTVFLGMTAVIILSLLFSLTEVIHLVGLKERVSYVSSLGAESVFADYNRLFWTDYHILAIDAGYGSGQMNLGKLEQRMRNYIEDNANPVLDERNASVYFFRSAVTYCCVDSYQLLSDGDGAMLIKEAAKEMLYDLPETTLNHLLSMGDSIEQSTNGAQDVEALLEAGNTALEENHSESFSQEDSIDRSSLPEVEVTENPIDLAMGWKEKAILSQVVAQEDGISNTVMRQASPPSKRTLFQGTQPAESVTASEKMMFGIYLQQNFQSFRQALGHHGLQYEWEYILNGKDSDQANLEATVVKLLGLREVENLAAIVADSNKMLTAESIAWTLAGVTANPAIVEAVKWGIIAAWAYLESVLDVRLLLKGGKVALIKTPQQWTSQITAFSAYLPVTVTAKECEGGLSYETYLLMMTYLMSTQKLGLHTLDIMEDALHATEEYQNVYVDQMIVEATFNYEYEGNPIFLSMVPLSNGIGPYHFYRSKEMSYL